MKNEILYSGYFLLVGIGITTIGNYASNYFQHKQRINQIKYQMTFREKIKVHMKIIGSINELQKIYTDLDEKNKFQTENDIWDEKVEKKEIETTLKKIKTWEDNIRAMTIKRDIWYSEKMKKILRNYLTKILDITKKHPLKQITEINQITIHTRKSLNIQIKKELNIPY